MADIVIDIGGEIFQARFEEAAAPRTVARFRQLLPYQDRIIHVRWSGEACWIPMGERDLSIGYENATSYPAPGRSSSTPARSAACQRPRSWWPTAPAASPARPASLPATTS
ncbi:DUF3830 family protein [Teichococcus aestuarii]|uniref:DUF3830 family protein n=1 Tax=Teichococcus aestuarii TaxID=568898 RepID=UPI00360A3B85